MSDCIFCKIIQGEIPCQKVYEDDNVLALLDINPTTKGHTVVITKKHYPNLVATPATELCQIITVIKNIAPAIVAASQAEGWNLGVNNGPAAGQIIEHVHFHIIPRKANYGLKPWGGKPYEGNEFAEYAEKIRKELK
jgi:histidine triad (HIT) family protein